MTFAILTLPVDTVPLAKVVAKEADSNRNALGFIAQSAYEEMCSLGRLFIAVSENSKGAKTYAGHVLFGGASSELHIHQLHVTKAQRRSGVGRALV